MVRSFFTCCWQLKKRAVLQLSPNMPAYTKITPCSDLVSIITPFSRDSLFCSGTNTISSRCMRNSQRTEGLPVSSKFLGCKSFQMGWKPCRKKWALRGEGDSSCLDTAKRLPSRGTLALYFQAAERTLGLKAEEAGRWGGEARALSSPLRLSLAPAGIDNIGSVCEI